MCTNTIIVAIEIWQSGVEAVKIKEVTKEHILFDNDSEITFEDSPDRSHNFADFGQIEAIAMNVDFPEELRFEKVRDTGFRFGFDGYMCFVPCYSEQNGYYTTDINIFFNGRQVLTAKGAYTGDTSILIPQEIIFTDSARSTLLEYIEILKRLYDTAPEGEKKHEYDRLLEAYNTAVKCINRCDKAQAIIDKNHIICPTCGYEIVMRITELSRYMRMVCPTCGQLVEWSLSYETFFEIYDAKRRILMYQQNNRKD